MAGQKQSPRVSDPWAGHTFFFPLLLSMPMAQEPWTDQTAQAHTVCSIPSMSCKRRAESKPDLIPYAFVLERAKVNRTKTMKQVLDFCV